MFLSFWKALICRSCMKGPSFLDLAAFLKPRVPREGGVVCSPSLKLLPFINQESKSFNESCS